MVIIGHCKLSKQKSGKIIVFFLGVGDPPLIFPRRRSREVIYNFPTEEQGIEREGSRIYLSLGFFCHGSAKNTKCLSSQDRKPNTFFESKNAKIFMCQYFWV